jgi:hypothetical protein
MGAVIYAGYSPVNRRADPAGPAGLDELERRKTNPTGSRRVRQPAPVRLHPNLAEAYRRQVADLCRRRSRIRRPGRRRWNRCAARSTW